MSSPQEVFRLLEEIAEKDPRYRLEAYTFVLSGLGYTMKRLKRSGHVSGQELTEGLGEYAVQEYGKMARTVMEHWGIKTTEDFGHIVFILIDHNLLGKTAQDRIDDFRNGFDFKEVFDTAFPE
jgi:uncharacterized repeat protein (TIGR04138 family)